MSQWNYNLSNSWVNERRIAKRNKEENFSTSCKTSLYKATSLKVWRRSVKMHRGECLFLLITPLCWCQREWLWTFISQCWGNHNKLDGPYFFFYLRIMPGFNRLVYLKCLLYTNDIGSKSFSVWRISVLF